MVWDSSTVSGDKKEQLVNEIKSKQLILPSGKLVGKWAVVGGGATQREVFLLLL